jgi:hypothetical protein
MNDPWLQTALDAGGHLSDDVARALLEDEIATANRRLAEYPGELTRTFDEELAETLRQDYPELD